MMRSIEYLAHTALFVMHGTMKSECMSREKYVCVWVGLHLYCTVLYCTAQCLSKCQCAWEEDECEARDLMLKIKVSLRVGVRVGVRVRSRVRSRGWGRHRSDR